jgi:cysteinyl-tRNA synthetase
MAGDASSEGDGRVDVAEIVRDAPAQVMAALSNDLNTSVALSIVGELARFGNELVMQWAKKRGDGAARDASRSLAAATVRSLDACCRPMGLMQASAEEFYQRTRARRLRLRGLDAATVEAKVKERTAARSAKDFARADAIRTELAALGVELQDVPGAGRTKWNVTI